MYKSRDIEVEKSMKRNVEHEIEGKDTNTHANEDTGEITVPEAASKHFEGECNSSNVDWVGESDEQDCLYYISGICGYECKTNDMRKKHMNIKHKYYSECLICFTMVSTEETMEEHFNSNHLGD